jgi:hypothetical protein
MSFPSWQVISGCLHWRAEPEDSAAPDFDTIGDPDGGWLDDLRILASG